MYHLNEILCATLKFWRRFSHSLEQWFPKWGTGPLGGSRDTALGVPRLFKEIKKTNFDTVLNIISYLKQHILIELTTIYTIQAGFKCFTAWYHHI